MWCAIATDRGYFMRGGIRSVVFKINQDPETHARYITDRVRRVVEKKGWLQYHGPYYGRTQRSAMNALEREIFFEFV